MKFKNVFNLIKYSIVKGCSFSDVLKLDKVHLYAGDIPEMSAYDKYIGLSIKKSDNRHIKHNVSEKYPLPDSCVDIYQSEDVFEHIKFNELPDIINEIYRVLKPGGIFRLSLPDFRCDLLESRTIKNDNGDIIFDPIGGGQFIDGNVVGGGHVWFPKYELVKDLLGRTKFKDYTFLHYYDEQGHGVTNEIDYSIGYIKRTPDNDERVRNPYRPMSIVVDCKKHY